nr:MAG: hypothetical protein DIU72_04855 [Pseudomonadota bacterium]
MQLTAMKTRFVLALAPGWSERAHLSFVCLVLSVFLLFPPAVRAQGGDQEELERELSRALAVEAPPPRASLLPDISVVGTFAAAWFSGEPTPRLAAHEPFHHGPQLQEIELGFRSNVDPFVRADVFLAVSLEGIEVEEAYVTTLAFPADLRLRGGEMYAPFGRVNQVHYLEATPFADLPLVNRRFFGGEQLRGLGLEVSYLLPLPFYAEIVGAALSAGNEVSFGIPATEIETPRDLLGVARLATAFDLGDRLTLLLGASYANGPNASGGLEGARAHRTQIWGADFTLRLRDAASRAHTALQAEWMTRRAEVPGGGFLQGGAYVWLVRRFDARWEAAIRGDILGLPSGRAFGDPHLGEEEVFLFAEAIHAHEHDHAHAETGEFLRPLRQRRLGASLSFYPSEFQRLRLQANYDFLPGEGRGIWEAFFQYQFVIGSHGAHAF